MAGLISWLDKERKKVQHDISNGAAAAYHGINPFDNGQGFTTRKPAPQPRPAPQPQQNDGFSFGRVLHDVTHNPVTNVIGNDVVKPFQQHVIPAIGNAPQTFGNDVLAPLNRDIARPAVNLIEQKNPGFAPAMHATGAVLGRTGVGLGQTASGLFDLATPGTGTNRVSDALNRAAEGIDQYAKNNNVNPIVYRGGQIAANLLGPGEIKGVLKAPELVRPAINAVDRVVPAVERVTQPLLDRGLAGRVAAKTIRGAANPKIAAANAGYQAYNVGQQAAQGQDINPLAQAATFGAFQAGLPLAGAVGSEVARPVINELRNTHLIRPTKLTNAELANIQRMRDIAGTGAAIGPEANRVFQGAYNSLNKVGIDSNDARAVDNLLTRHQVFENKLRDRKLALQAAKQRLVVNNEIGAVGKNVKGEMSAKPNSPLSRKTPEQSLTVRPGKTGTPANPQTGVALPNSTPLPQILPVEGKSKQSASTLLKSKNITPEVKKNLNPEYTAHSHTAQREQIARNVAKNLTAATRTASRLVEKDAGAMTDAEHQFVSTVAAALDAKGTKASQQLAENLYNSILRHRTATGQTFAAFREMSNSPGILKAQALNFLKNKSIELSKEEKGTLENLIKNLKGTQLGTRERDEALHNVIKFVTDKVPTRTGDKIVNLWRAGLLTSPITTGGNILGNTGEAVVRNTFVNPVATAADKLQSVVTGKRTKTLAGGQFKGGVVGAKDAKRYLKTGFDPNNPMTKFEGRGDVHYGDGKLGKATGGYVNAVYRGLGAQDKPFRQAAANQAKLDLAKADAINMKLKGAARQDYISKAVKDPEWEPQTFKTQNTSKAAGEFAVFANETALGKVAGKLKQPVTVNGKTYNGAFRQFIMPFTQVPASIAMRIIHRSDLGVGEIVNQMLRVRKGLPYDQRAVSEAIGNGTFGPAAIAAGYALSKAGQITGNYPTDPKERALWKSEGKQANSVRIGNRWYSLNYMQPFGTLLGIGDQVRQDEKAGKSPTDIISSATGRAAKSVESQSFLQGIDGLLSAVNDPDRSAKQYINSTFSSVTPNIIKTIARATDPLQRGTGNVGDAIKGTIPGVRETLPAKQDMFGKPLKGYDNAANQLFNPLRPSLVRNANDPVVKELRRLQDGGNGIVTTQFNKSTFAGGDGKGPKLTDPQIRQLNSLINGKVKTAWGQLIKDPRYKDLSDEDKSTALKRAKDQIASAYKRQFASKNNINSALDKPATASDIAILSNQTPDYIGSIGSNTSTASYYKAPDAEYKTYLAKYNQNVKAGSYDAAQKITATRTLQKLKIGSVYPKTVRDLYSLSKANLYSYLTKKEKGVDKVKISKQLQAYDTALYNAGLISYRKFKTGLAPSKGGRSGRGGTSAAEKNFAAGIRFQAAKAAPKVPTFSGGPKAPARYVAPALKKYTPKNAPSKGNFSYSIRKGLV